MPFSHPHVLHQRATGPTATARGLHGLPRFVSSLIWQEKRALAKGFLLSIVRSVLLFAVLAGMLIAAMSGGIKG